MGTISLQTPTVGQLNSTEDPKITSDFNVLQTLVNGNIDTNNLKSTTAGITRRQLALGASYPNNVVSSSTNQSPNPGTMVVAQASLTVFLPSAVAGSLVGVYNVFASFTVTIIAGGGSQIQTRGANFAPSTFLSGTAGACWVFLADGSNWLQVGGNG